MDDCFDIKLYLKKQKYIKTPNLVVFFLESSAARWNLKITLKNKKGTSANILIIQRLWRQQKPLVIDNEIYYSLKEHRLEETPRNTCLQSFTTKQSIGDKTGGYYRTYQKMTSKSLHWKPTNYFPLINTRIVKI